MDKLKMHSPDLSQENIAKVRELFPGCVTEARDDSTGKLRLSVDFDQLKQELSDHIVDGPQERYRLDWPSKKEAIIIANAPIAKTLRPSLEESSNFESSRNLFIEGDNLEGLKLLQEAYLGVIKLIYIDPPYNTGRDFVYQDDFAQGSTEFLKRSMQHDNDGNRLLALRETEGRFHSEWLSMIYSRLLISRNLLCQEGIIVISVDEKEHANLKKVCDEIFGAKNFCGEIVWKNSSKNDQAYISIQHEYFVVYVKDKETNPGDWTERKAGLDEIYKAFGGFLSTYGKEWDAIHKAALEWYKEFPPSNPIYDSKHYSWMDDRGVYFPADISGPNDGQYVYSIDHPITKRPVKEPSRGWSCPKEHLLSLISEDRVHFGKDETTVPCLKTYLKSTETVSLTSMRFLDGRAASKRLRTLFGEKVFTNPKDEFLLAELFKAMKVRGNDIVLDFFGGSGTTAHAVFELNRIQGSRCAFHMIQIAESLEESLKVATGAAKKITKNAIRFLEARDRPATVAEISKERIRRAGKKVIEGDCHPDWNRDVGFRVLKVDTSNMKDVYYRPDEVKQADLLDMVDNVKEDRTAEDLLFQVLVDWGVDLTLPIRRETIQGKMVFFVDDNALVACFEPGVTEDLVKELAGHEPLRIIFRDKGFVSDAVKINVEQIFRQLSPSTEVKSI
ncbi:site-specific DNA-methyltransferase [Thiocapsa marina]|uniref:site-specific DNA-methyltransferase (adenine-specific) n=1 Tax=Thiocapsa marina 5811 TaxID=768671 RepID=F9UH37_9GAMM|nr:site-specific DNA-methyltransferase [Thiocapsa marina]EGV16441.1 Site-specific DNA-methyltransferase (adenine-specific) [Thiocapsa marina 5811]